MPLFLVNYYVAFYFATYLCLVFIYYSVNGQESRSLTVAFCMIFILVNVIFHSFSLGFAPDKEIYQAKFENIDNFYSIAHFGLGVGLYYLYIFLNYINFPSEHLVILHSLIINIGFFIVCLDKRLGKETFLAYFIFSMSWFFVDMSTNSIRQGISSFLFLGFIFSLFSKRKVQSVLLLVLSFLFHWSVVVPAIITYFAFWFKSLSSRNNWYAYLGLYAFLLVSIITELVSIRILIELFSAAVNLEFLSLKVNSYFNASDSTYKFGIFERVSLFFELIVYCALSLVVFYFTKNVGQSQFERMTIFIFWSIVLYATLSIGMAHAYRNFYWALCVLVVSIIPVLSRIKKSVNIKSQSYYFFICMMVMLFSSFSLWRSGLVYALYDHL
ncbi:TPA: hypothetical protein I7680_07560 [Vibrio vulnificus]|nr:hypothetical protein [Vibrio vulnificus]HAS8445443.1 hypothetical protein [Vibrio vulnificus]HAS8454898.1 hypothetical protein [Vibrio vulnificus]HDY7725109.1 EpsG family protein [Vibrio vulnificus]